MRMRGCWCLFLCSGHHLRFLNIVIDLGRLNLLFKIAGWYLQIWRLQSAYVSLYRFFSFFVCFSYILIPNDGIITMRDNESPWSEVKHDKCLEDIQSVYWIVLNLNVATTVIFKFESNKRCKNYFIALHSLAVFTVSIDISVFYPELFSQSKQLKFGTFSLLPFFIFSTSINTTLWWREESTLVPEVFWMIPGCCTACMLPNYRVNRNIRKDPKECGLSTICPWTWWILSTQGKPRP